MYEQGEGSAGLTVELARGLFGTLPLLVIVPGDALPFLRDRCLGGRQGVLGSPLARLCLFDLARQRGDGLLLLGACCLQCRVLRSQAL